MYCENYSTLLPTSETIFNHDQKSQTRVSVHVAGSAASTPQCSACSPFLLRSLLGEGLFHQLTGAQG